MQRLQSPSSLSQCIIRQIAPKLKRTRRKVRLVTTKVARLETTKTRSHKGTKKRKSFEILGVLSDFAPLW